MVQRLVSVQLKVNPLCTHEQLVGLLQPEWLVEDGMQKRKDRCTPQELYRGWTPNHAGIGYIHFVVYI